MNTGAFGEGFPYSNFHDLNLDWVIKIAKDFLDQYTHIQEIIAQGIIDIGDKTTEGLNDLDEKAEALETLLQTWYDTHSEDIANQLADALAEILENLASAEASFNTYAETRATETLASIPSDYTTLYNTVMQLSNNLKPLYNAYNLLVPYLFNTTTVNGLTFAKTSDYGYDVTGTKGSASTAFIDFFRNKSAFPTGISTGKTYGLYLKSDKIGFRIVGYRSADDASGISLLNIGTPNMNGITYARFYIPNNITGLAITFRFDGSGSYDERVYACLMPTTNSFISEVYADEFNLIPDNLFFNVKNIVNSLTISNNTINHGLNITNKGNGIFHIEGTKTSGSGTTEFVLYRNASVIGYPFKKGKKYNIYINTSSNFYIWLSAYYNDTVVTGSTTIYKSSFLGGEQIAQFEIPNTATGIGFAIRYDNATTVDEDIQICILEELETALMKKLFTNNYVNVDYSAIDLIPNIFDSYNVVQNYLNGVNALKTGKNEYYFEGTVGDSTSTWFDQTMTLDLFRSKTVMPTGFEAGKTYYIKLNSYDAGLWLIWYAGSGDSTGTVLWKSTPNYHGEQVAMFTIPSEAHGMSIAFKLNDAESFDEVVTINASCLKTEKEAKFINGVYRNQYNSSKKLLAVGNSFLRGAVFNNGSQTELCSWDDAIFGQIAMALNISEENTVMNYYPSTGLLQKHNDINLTEVINNTDLTNYDYLLTHCNGADLTRNLGTINSTADDGTVAGCVVSVLEHIKTSNGLCKLILLGTPPYNASIAGQDVFITPVSGGHTINDMDNLMYALAKKYHFIYVSWQDLEISYHYMDFCDYHEGDTGAVHANSPATYRALGAYAGTQLSVGGNPIAIQKQNQ